MDRWMLAPPLRFMHANWDECLRACARDASSVMCAEQDRDTARNPFQACDPWDPLALRPGTPWRLGRDPLGFFFPPKKVTDQHATHSSSRVRPHR
eukprot:4374540-Prymnesium_polylepis.1